MKNFMTSPPPEASARKGLWQASLLGALLAVAASAHAVGTASNVTISNQATLSYQVGGVAQPNILSDGDSLTAGVQATTFLVDNKVDVLVSGGITTTSGVVAGATLVATTFTVTNEGNTTQDFRLDIISAISGDSFDPTACTVSNVAISSGSMGTYTALDQHINALTADSVATVTVTCSIPAGVTNGNTGLVALLATAKADDAANSLGADLAETGAATAGVDIVFADDAGTDDPTGARDAVHSARNTYQVASAILTVNKSVTTVCDPFNGTTNPKNIPGALVKWSVTVSNDALAGSSATLTQISDALNANTTFDADFELGNSAANCAATANQATSAIGSGFRLSCAGGTRACNTPVFFTTSNTSDAIDLSGSTVYVNFNGGALAGTTGAALPAEGTYTAGELKPGETVTLEFQVFIN